MKEIEKLKSSYFGFRSMIFSRLWQAEGERNQMKISTRFKEKKSINETFPKSKTIVHLYALFRIVTRYILSE